MVQLETQGASSCLLSRHTLIPTCIQTRLLSKIQCRLSFLDSVPDAASRFEFIAVVEWCRNNPPDFSSHVSPLKEIFSFICICWTPGQMYITVISNYSKLIKFHLLNSQSSSATYHPKFVSFISNCCAILDNCFLSKPIIEVPNTVAVTVGPAECIFLWFFFVGESFSPRRWLGIWRAVIPCSALSTYYQWFRNQKNIPQVLMETLSICLTYCTCHSPYGCIKLYRFWITVNYQELYPEMYTYNGILFNHEHPRQGWALHDRGHSMLALNLS